jgi:hypothetical protein
MAKKARKKKVVINITDLIRKPLEIVSATLKDGRCNYKYKLNNGPTPNFIHTVTGEGLYHHDLHNAFSSLNVHAAFIDDTFKTAGLEVNSFETIENNALTGAFDIHQVKVTGHEETKCVYLIGTKYVDSLKDRQPYTSPKIPIGKRTYKFYNELDASVELCINEVEEYNKGKFAPVEEEEPTTQLSIESAEAAEEALSAGAV